MRQLTTYRNLQVFLVIMAIIGMSFALFYLQRHLGLSPCPLCIFQRVGLIVMGGFALISALFNPKSKVIRLLLWLGSLVGIGWATAVAARHVWLQHLPADQVPSCGPGLNYWLDTLPILQVFKEVFAGSGECASVDWTLMGLSIPEQSLILFSVLLIVHVLILMRIVKSSK
ncbi:MULTISPECIES: disulfide bond formation protein B [Psychrobacter]|jgi:disulfide bond formation protein DsbB|uniref:disulfide bond formation protein B n=1 Tax=Psychrobacter TaxID=497 RepID=UPI00086A46D1|nr:MULTISPECIES: disulfide bond formation protein B [unclassified Psychrobacter]MCG3841973.1 disulfide bond formation protein B [Psychrobacter sp. Ps1]OEH67785.1 MAG: dihydrolipoamide acetyltransferase [Psychrobacter sp. B29-1]PKG67229.1 disulfide bond formation protein B [Psychrobacter sp. Choline-02u-13]PKH53757.1 disulfide bond formation protein B [Psychrobacter sp. Choline-02u-9]PLT23701.1 disulfide bond formation protein B [Psychrobacter sp. MES7-P7E]|tara:strand:+ start:33843 stop:34355 length:513 start_codon:yes stop_codon:yes gene_type:complete